MALRETRGAARADEITLGLLPLRGRHSADPRWLRLAARLALLTGHYSDAVAQYRRAMLAGGRDLDSELAIAFAVRAEADKRPSDYGLALEYCDESTSLDKVSH